MLIRKSSIVAAGLFALAVVGYGLLPSRQALGQPQGGRGVGRYQVALGGGNPSACVLVDTSSGQTWIYQGGGWQDLGTPVKAGK